MEIKIEEILSEFSELRKAIKFEDIHVQKLSSKKYYLFSSIDQLEKKLYDLEHRIKYDKDRVNNLHEILIKYIQLDFSKKINVQPDSDCIDILGKGLNVLGEELNYYRKGLQENEQKTKAIIDNAPDAIIVINSEGEIINWNRAASKIFGWTELETLGKPIHELIIPETFRQSHLKGLRHFLKTSEGPVLNKVIEVVALRKNMPAIDIELNISPARLKNDYLFIAFLRDITERKKSHQVITELNANLDKIVKEKSTLLKLSEENYRRLFENNPLPNWVLEIPSLKFIDVNEAAIKHYGYTREEFLTMTAVHIRPPDEKERFLNLARTAGQDSRVSSIWKHIKKDGSVIHVEISAHDVEINGQRARSVVCNDITEKLKAQMALKYSETRFRRIFESKLIGLIFWNSAGEILEANDVFLNMLGYSKNDLKLGKVKWTLLTPPEYAEMDKNAIEQISKNGVSEPYEKEYFRKDGTRIQIMIAATSLGDDITDDGVAYILDIEKPKRLEKEIKELNNNLEKKVLERTEQLQRVNKELESFSYSVSHDLRAPLRAITGYSNILVEDYSNDLDDEAKRLLQNVINNSQKMGQLIDDLLEFSRMGKRGINRTITDITKIAKEAWEELGGKKIKNDIITIKQLGVQFTDPVLLAHVFKNLISNAIKYSSKTSNPHITISSSIENNSTIYAVQDNGCGFDMNYYDKLFGVFQRLHNDKEYEGTGVGLAIVKRIVTRLGGDVYAHGETNNGATFYFTLPINNIKFKP